MIRWAIFSMIVIVSLHGLIGWWLGVDLSTLRLQLRYLSGITFMLAMVMSSVLSFNRKRFFPKEWSFFLLIVTLGLFSISVI